MDDTLPTLMVVADAPGDDDDLHNKTLIGRSGQLVRFLLKHADLGHYNIYLTNAVKCRPPKVVDERGTPVATPTPQAMIDCCGPTLAQEIERVRPTMIVAMGTTAATLLTNDPALDGDWKPHTLRTGNKRYKNGGYVYTSAWGIPVIVTYSPEAIVRAPMFGPFLNFDLCKAALNTRFDCAHFKKPGTVIHLRTVAELEAAVEHADQVAQSDDPYMAFDFETANLSRCRGKNRPLSLMWAFDGDTGYGVLIDHPDAPWTDEERVRVKDLCRRLLKNRCIKIAHNAKFDIAIARSTLGVQVSKCLYDTMLMQYLLDENISAIKQGPIISSSLEAMAQFWLDYYDPAWDTVKGERARLEFMDGNLVVEYGTKDAMVTFRLFRVMRALLYAKTGALRGHEDVIEGRPAFLRQQYFDRPMRVLSRITNVLAEIEVTGLPVDVELARQYLDPNHPNSLKVEMARRYAQMLENESFRAFNHQLNDQQDKGSLWTALLDVDENLFVPTNPRHLVKFYYEYLGLTAPEGTKDDKLPTGKEFEEVYAKTHPIVKMIKEYKELDKMRSFVEIFITQAGYNPDARIRANYGQNRTVTGRLACTDPNLQQIPRASDNEVKARIKRLIKAPPGFAFIQADYGTAEVRVGALNAQDEVLAGNFKRVREIIMGYRNNPTVEAYTRVHINGEADTHKQNYANVFGIPVAEVTKTQRTEAKAITFGCMFSEEPAYQLAGKLNCSVEVAQTKVDTFLGPFANLVKYLKTCSAAGENIGYVHSGFGRCRLVYGAWSQFKSHKHAKNQAQNSPIQSTSSDITLLAAYRLLAMIHRKGLRWQIINAVHDALYLLVPIDELPTALPVIEQTMLNPGLEEFGIDPNFVPLEVEFEIGINGADVVVWDYTQEHLDLITPWLTAGGIRADKPKSPFDPRGREKKVTA